MKKILVVDDEKKIRSIYCALLAAEGYNPIGAPCASDAYDILTREKIDLVLLDINMPEIDGGMVSELIDTFHLHTKVIVCSVRPLVEQKQIIKNAADYYDKSEGLEALRTKIAKILADGI